MGSDPSMGRGNFKEQKAQPRSVVKYSNSAVSCAKVAQPIEMPFGVWTRVGPRKHVLGGGAQWRNLANTIEPVDVRQRCGLLSNYFDHLLLLALDNHVSPLPSNRHHRSCGDRLEGKGENYQVCSVQYCVQQLCTVRCTHI